MKPLIVHIRASNFFGGPERQIVGHVQTSQHYEHLVVTFLEGTADNEFERVCRAQDIPVVTIATAHAYQWSSVRQLRALLSARQPAVICCHGYKPLVLSLLAKKGMRIPLVAFSRGHTSENLKIRIFEWTERKLYAFADVIVAVSQGYANALQQHGVRAERIAVVRNAVRVDKFLPHFEQRSHTRRQLGFSDEDFLIATAGRLSPEKAQADLLAAFARFSFQRNQVHLLLCGDGPLREALERQAAQSSCRNVHFLGHRTDLDALMPVFDVFVLPSLTEGLPNVLLEAASCRVPIVATRVGGVPEIITDGESGFLVAPGNVDQLVAALERCLVEPATRARFAGAAYRVVEERYGFAAQTSKLESLYHQVATGGRPSHR